MKKTLLRILILSILVLSLSLQPLFGQKAKEIRVWQGGNFITKPEQGKITVTDDPLTGLRTVSYRTPAISYTYVIDGQFQMISYAALVNDPKLSSVFMANEVLVDKTEAGYTYKRRRGNAAWEVMKLPVRGPVMFFGGVSNYLQEKLKNPQSLPFTGKITCIIPPFMPVEMDYKIVRIKSGEIPGTALPITTGQPPEEFRKFQAGNQPIFLAEYRLSGLAWLFYPHPFYFALEDDGSPELLANWGGRTDTEDYFIVYAPAVEPVTAVLR
jgi:hypothetical protein